LEADFTPTGTQCKPFQSFQVTNMRVSTMLALAFCTAILAPTVSAQGVYTERGFGAELGFETGGDSPSSFDGGFGYVLNRLFEAGVNILHTSHPDDQADVSYLYITPRVRFYGVRQTESVPVTAWVEGHYNFISLSGDDAEGGSADGYGVSVGATRAFEAGANLGIRPILSVALTKFHEEYEYDAGEGTQIWEFDSNPVYVTFAIQASAGVGANTLYGGPVLRWSSAGGTETDAGETTEYDTSTDTQFGLRVGLVIGR